MVGGRQLLVEDNLQCKVTFGERQPSVEDDPRRKMTFCGRRLLLEDDLCWKTTFVGRQTTEKDGLWWKTTDDFQWKTTFGGPCMLPTPLCGIFTNKRPWFFWQTHIVHITQGQIHILVLLRTTNINPIQGGGGGLGQKIAITHLIVHIFATFF